MHLPSAPTTSTIPPPPPPPPAPPFLNYGILTGQMFLYQQGQVAFESPCPTPQATPQPQSQSQSQSSTTTNLLFRPNKLIVIGGLSDGLLPVPYLQELHDEICGCVGDGVGGDDGGGDTDTSSLWSIVQPTLRSSYTGFGHGSLERDCDDLCKLLMYLSMYRGAQRFALLGHSTGCQDLVYFWKQQHATKSGNSNNDKGTILPAEIKSKIKLLILQAPVSDREGVEESDESLPSKIQYAQSLVDNGQGDEMVPRSYFWTPLTAQRFLDLHQRNGNDDFFSSDFSDDELIERLSHISKDSLALSDDLKHDDDVAAVATTNTTEPDDHPLFQVLVAYSGEDEYVPSHVNKHLLTERLVRAMNAHCYDNSSSSLTTNENEKEEVVDDPRTTRRLPVAHGLYLPTGNHNLSNSANDVKLFVDKVSEMIQRISSSSQSSKLN